MKMSKLLISVVFLATMLSSSVALAKAPKSAEVSATHAPVSYTHLTLPTICSV